jgi:Haem-binding domain
MRPGFKSRTCRGPVRGRLLPAIAIVMGLSVVAGCSSSEPALTPTPPAAISPDPEVDRILSASCYSCHTVEGSEELVARLQPSRWFGHDAALEQLNFSQWGTYDAQKRADTARQIAAAVNDGTMPPSGYLLFHSQARLSPEGKAAITRWADAVNAQH